MNAFLEATTAGAFGGLHELSSRWSLRRCAEVGAGTRARGRLWIHGRGTVRIGASVTLDARHFPIELHALEPDSEIVIGDGAVLEGGTSIEAVLSVRVGARTRLGSFCRIMDNHFHPLLGDRHWRPPSAAVVIGDGAEVGARAILLAGAQVGDGARVRAGAVITRRVRIPAGGRAQGLPATLE